MINFYLNHDKKRKNKNLQLYCWIRYSGKTIYLKTAIQIEEKHWDSKKQLAKKTCNDCVSINNYVQKFKNEVNEVIRSLPINFTFDDLQNALKKPSKYTIMEAYEIFKEAKSGEIDIKTIKRTLMVITKFLNFLQSKDKQDSINEITLLNMDLFRKYLIETGINNNTISKQLSILKTFFIWLNERGILQNVDWKNFRNKNYEVENIALTDEELNLLWNYKSKTNYLNSVKNIFLFSCFTGARFSDVMQFNKNDLINGIWNLRVQKTKDIIYIPITEKAMQLIVLVNYEIPKISNQKANKYIKELCKEAGINSIVTKSQYKGNQKVKNEHEKWELIGTHTARRTFVTLSLQKGMRAEVLMKITGHKELKTLQKYIKVSRMIQLKEAKQVWDNQKLG